MVSKWFCWLVVSCLCSSMVWVFLSRLMIVCELFLSVSWVLVVIRDLVGLMLLVRSRLVVG